MRIQLVALLILMVSAGALARGPSRAPAVEDFVGIEVDHPDTSPQGKDSLYNLEQDMQQLEQIEVKAVSKASTPREHKMDEANQFIQWTPMNIIAWSLLLVLPLMSWFVAVQHLRKKASVESASNVEVLQKYRQEREEARKKEEEYRKVG